jgi:hypothetical protein
MKQRLEKGIEPSVHLYPFQIIDDHVEEDNRWN